MKDSDTTTATSFELIVPAEADMLRVVRLAASGMASFADLDLAGVEGLRVGADELVSTLIQAGGSMVSIRFSLLGDVVSVTATTELTGGSHYEVDPLTDRLLDELVTSHSFSEADGTLTGQIELRR